VLGGSFEHKEGGGGGGMATKLLRQGGKVRGRKAQSEGFRVEGRGARREKKIREKRWDFSLVKSSASSHTGTLRIRRHARHAGDWEGRSRNEGRRGEPVPYPKKGGTLGRVSPLPVLDRRGPRHSGERSGKRLTDGGPWNTGRGMRVWRE